MDSAHIDKKIGQAVQQVSRSQIYQKRLFLFLCLVWNQVAFNSLINPMILTNPLFKCKGHKATQAQYCSYIHMDQPQEDHMCQYLNDFTGTYYAGLYCHNRDTRMTLQSLFAFGSVVGSLAMPAIGDLRGKYIAMNYSLFITLISNLSILFGIYAQIYISIGIGLFLSGFGTVAAAVLSYSINSDFFSHDRREKAVIYYCAVWGLTDMFILVVYYLMPYWLIYVVILLTLPMACLYTYFRMFFLDTLHSLINTRSDFIGARQLIQKLATINQASQQQLKKSLALLQQIQKQKQIRQLHVPDQQLTLSQALTIILRNPKYLKSLLCLIFIKMAYYSFYYGVQGCLERTGFNFGISVFLLGFGEFTGYMTGTKFVPQMKRKLVLGVTNVGVAGMGLLFITQTVGNSPLLASILLYLCYTVSSYNFSAISLLQTQSFSSKIRSTALGLDFAFSMTIRLFLPFLIGYLNQMHIQPIIVSSILVLVLGLSPTIIIDETFGYRDRMGIEEGLVQGLEMVDKGSLTKGKGSIDQF